MGRNPSGQGAKPRSRLLIVEDDDLMRIFYKSLFQRFEAEFACRYEKNGSDALLYLKANEVDAVIMDWDMPKMTGIALIKAVRSEPARKDIRLIMVTGRTSPADKLLALKSGADEFLSKPCDVEVLLARLRDLLRR